MKKIAFFSANLLRGGSERIISRLSLALENTYDVYVIVCDGQNVAYEIGGILIDLKLPAVDGFVGKAFNTLKRISELRKIIKKNNIDLVYSFTSAANLTNAFSCGNWKKIISCRGYGSLLGNLRKYHLQVMASDGIVFNSVGMEDYYLQNYPKDRKKTHLLHNIFDSSKITVQAQEPTDEQFNAFAKHHKIITTVSYFSPTKGQWHLIKAFEILKEWVPDAGLVFVGNRGSIEEDIRQMANRSQYRDDILFLGVQENPFKYVAKSDVYALCSITEGFPNALVEAMLCKTPVVATDCKTGPAEILINNYDRSFCCRDLFCADYGILLPAFDAEIDFNLNNRNKKHHQFATALTLLLTDGELNEKYSRRGVERAKQFDEKNILEAYIALIGNF